MADTAILAPPAEQLYMDLIDQLQAPDTTLTRNVVPNPRPDKFYRVELAGIVPINKVEFNVRCVLHSYDYDDAAAEEDLRILAAKLVAFKQEMFQGWYISWSEANTPIIRNDDPEVEGLVRYQYMHNLRMTGKAL